MDLEQNNEICQHDNSEEEGIIDLLVSGKDPEELEGVYQLEADIQDLAAALGGNFTY